jgi:putative tryptophan/tyrosine transport system substrate-binding protein
MRRREFLGLAAGAATAWPLAARAQQPAIPVIGFLNSRSAEDAAHLIVTFRSGLAERGYVEGRNLVIEYRWGLGDYDRLPDMALELVRRPVAVLVASGGEPAALAAAAATKTVPIIYVIGGDPVEEGLAASFNRPGGNATGVTLGTTLLEPKRFGLLHELVPQATRFAVLLNPRFPGSEIQTRDVKAAASATGVQIEIMRASNEDELETAFRTISAQRFPALAICADPFFDTRRKKLVDLAAQAAVPTMYHFREYTEAGGLISYGIDNADAYRQAGVYTAQVLAGADPAELPVMQEAKFSLVINLKTAKELGLRISDNVLTLANEVIE